MTQEALLDTPWKIRMAEHGWEPVTDYWGNIVQWRYPTGEVMEGSAIYAWSQVNIVPVPGQTLALKDENDGIF